ncbi:MAG: S1-like domain-containing RNA-binding protein [Bacilli bacterium]
MKLGQVSQYQVERETDIGYLITDESGEYFLHHNECAGHVLRDGEEVNAFLYMDKMKRVAATLHRPAVTIDQGGLCEVVGVMSAGVFINIGISRDILLSSDDLPEGKWPIVGDKVCGRLYIRGKNIFFHLMNKQEMLELRTGVELAVDQKAEGWVYRLTDSGINLVDANYNIIFIYYKNLRKDYRLGELAAFRVTFKNEDDYTATTVEQKERMMSDDADVILEYLTSHFGVMSYTSDTDSEILYNVFKMSKSAFKRALGHLYKEKKVILQNNKTILVDYE